MMRILLVLLACSSAAGFAPSNSLGRPSGHGGHLVGSLHCPSESLVWARPRATWMPLAQSSKDNDDVVVLAESEQVILGTLGIFSSLVVFVSEYVLKTTGCGLPAGPGGLFGLIEGVSYLGVLGLVSYATFTKVKTGSGLPSGPGGVLGAAEGLSFLAVAVGLVVLVLQVANYGYIPNAVPMEGGMCS